MRRIWMVLAVLGALVAGGFFDGHKAMAATSFGAPPELAGIDYPEPRVFLETQDWWQQGNLTPAPDLATFAFTSVHVHLGINFPLHEQFTFPAAGSGYQWDYLGQWHENVGGAVRRVRGGGAGFSTGCPDDGIPFDPGYTSVPITDTNQRHAGAIPVSAAKVNCWRDEIGPREFRFTADTTSRFGKRQYQSFGAISCLNAACSAGGVTARGWYEGPGYTNVTLKTAVRASTLANGTAIRPGQTLSYSLAQGANWAFALIDPDIHHGVLGTIAMPMKAGTSGSFTVPTDLAPGPHVLLLGGVERSTGANGFNGGILRLPFMVT